MDETGSSELDKGHASSKDEWSWNEAGTTTELGKLGVWPARVGEGSGECRVL